ncbi:hypothetical protein ACLOJK_037789 [Asimina triloba]
MGSYRYEGNGRNPITVGPWGGQGGTQWDDGMYTTVKKIIVVHGDAIDSIQFEYDSKGKSVWSQKHGGNGGSKTDPVNLDHPDEYLVAISGHYGPFRNFICVRSLAFQSNRHKYGPFGVQQGTCFQFPMTGAKIVGFHGSSGWYLDAIGVYLKPLPTPNSTADVSRVSRTLTTLSQTTANRGGGYSVVQGSVGKGYDIVLAVREKEDSSAKQNSWKSFSKKSSSSASSSSDSSDDESQDKLAPIPSFTDKGSPIMGGPVSYGPWGGSGGVIFDDGVYTGIRRIDITRNIGITSIKVVYDRNGQAIWGSKNGGSGGIKTDKIVFDYPYEILTHISGYYGTTLIMGPTAVKSLTFHTTKRKYGPFGDEQGTFFSTNLKEGMIVGFHGRCGWYIDSIGVHVLEGKVSVPTPPAPTSYVVGNAMLYPAKNTLVGGNLALPAPPNNTSVGDNATPAAPTSYSSARGNSMISELEAPQWSNKLVPAKKEGFEEEVPYRVVKEPVPSGPGPWGGDGGRPWDDGVYSGIRQIFVTKGEGILTAIQMEYDRNGQSVWSAKHGGNGGEVTHRIRFEHPNEVLNCITGYYGCIKDYEGHKVIKSLTFYTTRGKYGPYGEEIGTFFTSATTQGKVVGFHGRSGSYLDAIGVHMQHWLGERRPARLLISKFFG